jgi:hypothetical protein
MVRIRSPATVYPIKTECYASGPPFAGVCATLGMPAAGRSRAFAIRGWACRGLRGFTAFQYLQGTI